MEDCTQTQAVGGLSTAISPQQFKTKRVQYRKQASDTTQQCTMKEHHRIKGRQNRKEGKTVLDAQKVGKAIDLQQIFNIHQFGVHSYAGDEHFPVIFRGQQIIPSFLFSWASSSLSVIQAFGELVRSPLCISKKLRDRNLLVQLYKESYCSPMQQLTYATHT